MGSQVGQAILANRKFLLSYVSVLEESFLSPHLLAAVQKHTPLRLDMIGNRLTETKIDSWITSTAGTRAQTLSHRHHPVYTLVGASGKEKCARQIE